MSAPPRLRRLGLLSAAALAAGFVVTGFGWPGFLLGKSSVAVAPTRSEAELEFVPNAEQRAAMETLRASLQANGGRFSADDARHKANAKLFTYMAATSDDRRVVEASLEAIQSAYSPRSTRKEAPDDILDRVLVKHLRSPEPAILDKALRAAQVPLLGKEPSEKLVLAITGLARERKDGADCYAIIEVLNLLRPERRSAAVIGVFESALSAPEPYVVADALLALEQSLEAPSLRSKELAPRLVELAKHADPGVRGSALHLLAELDGPEGHALALERALAALTDEQPYVRGVACDVLGRLGNVSAVHELMRLVDDKAKSRYELGGFAKLDGQPGSMSFGVPGRLHVSEAAMYAASTLSPGQLSLAIGGPRQTEESLAKNAELTKAWYEKAKGQIPRDPASQAQ